jgi:hypothetical protein
MASGEMERRASVQDEVIPEAIVSNATDIPDDDLRQIQTMDDAMAYAVEQWGEVTDFAAEFGTGFIVLPKQDKSKLVGKRCLVLSWKFYHGDFGTFVSALVVTDDGKYIVNDGGTGIAEQLYDVSLRMGDRRRALALRHGLRESEYDTCAECDRPRRKDDAECGNCGDESEARHRGTTYYLDTSL